MSPHFLSDGRHVDVLIVRNRALPVDLRIDGMLGTHPATVQPQDIDLPVITGQLFHLRMREFLEGFPALGIFLGIVADIAVFRGEILPPVIRCVPVGLAEICADHHAFFPKSVEYFQRHICLGMLAERA